jgi:hypothetical protein
MEDPLALEHSKVCTLCDFGHLQLFLYFCLFCALNCVAQLPGQ